MIFENGGWIVRTSKIILYLVWRCAYSSSTFVNYFWRNDIGLSVCTWDRVVTTTTSLPKKSLKPTSWSTTLISRTCMRYSMGEDDGGTWVVKGYHGKGVLWERKEYDLGACLVGIERVREWIKGCGRSKNQGESSFL